MEQESHSIELTFKSREEKRITYKQIQRQQIQSGTKRNKRKRKGKKKEEENLNLRYA